MATEAAEAAKGYNDEAERVREHALDKIAAEAFRGLKIVEESEAKVRVGKAGFEAALAELKANDTDEGKAAYAKLLAETQPVLDILDDVLGED